MPVAGGVDDDDPVEEPVDEDPVEDDPVEEELVPDVLVLEEPVLEELAPEGPALEAEGEVDAVEEDPPPQPVRTVTTAARPKKTLRIRINLLPRDTPDPLMAARRGEPTEPSATACDRVQAPCRSRKFVYHQQPASRPRQISARCRVPGVAGRGLNRSKHPHLCFQALEITAKTSCRAPATECLTN